ncbi:MAG: cyclic nucleotide-binding domain-containing protein [Pseudomonadota bacterium]
MSSILSQTAALPETSFGPGTVLLREGDLGGPLFVLTEGTVAVLKGDIEVARVSEPGALFGEMSALLDLPVSASVIAVDTVRARVSEDPLPFLRDTPGIALHAARILAARLHSATSYLVDIKAQYQDRSDHFRMVDRVLDAIVEQQPGGARASDPDGDPRL